MGTPPQLVAECRPALGALLAYLQREGLDKYRYFLLKFINPFQEQNPDSPLPVCGTRAHSQAAD